MPEIGVLILAAGGSTRMGQPKQLLPWNNTTLLGHTITIAREISEMIMVVLGCQANQVKNEIPEHVNYSVNEAWKKGIGSSIAHGVNELQKMSNPRAILVLLADQPLIDAHYLNQIVQKKTGNEIVATSYGDKAGVPALFPKGYFEELKTLNGDYGAKQLLQRYAAKTIKLSANDKTIDIDTPEIYSSLKKSNDYFYK